MTRDTPVHVAVTHPATRLQLEACQIPLHRVLVEDGLRVRGDGSVPAQGVILGGGVKNCLKRK